MKDETPIDRIVMPALKQVARHRSYFAKREVVYEVLRRRGLADAVKDVRRNYPGYGFDVIVIRYIESCVGRALQTRDENGIRIYECYSTGNGERRWMRFRAMGAHHLSQALADCEALRDQLAAKAAFYELVIAELKKAGATASVEDVYDVIARRRGMIEDVARAELKEAS